MYRLCTTEKSAHQQRQIEAAFLSLMLEQSYQDITISEICQRSGYTRRIFYRLFDHKGDVLIAALDHTFEDFMAYEPDESVGGGGLHRFFAFWKEKKPLLDALAQNNISSALTERALNHIFKENPEILREFGADISEFGRETMLFFVSGLFSLVFDWHEQGYARSIDQMSRFLMGLLSSSPVKHNIPPEA